MVAGYQSCKYKTRIADFIEINDESHDCRVGGIRLSHIHALNLTTKNNWLRVRYGPGTDVHSVHMFGHSVADSRTREGPMRRFLHRTGRSTQPPTSSPASSLPAPTDRF